MSATATATSGRAAYKVTGLIGIAHTFSHFFQLALPPLFVVLRQAFDVGYAELGVLTTLFYLASGLSQTPAGFLVDRFGARRVLFCGQGLLAGSILLCGLAPSYWALMPLMVLAGMGNSVFHPADYSILTASIDRSWLGRAYGIHTLGGNIGWALAPITMLALSSAIGWRGALVTAGAAGLLVLVLLLLNAPALHDGRRAGARRPSIGLGEATAVFTSAPILLCFFYFVLLSIAQVGLQNFLPATLAGLRGIDLPTATRALTALLLGSSVGILAGSVAADRGLRPDLIVAGGLAVAALLVLLVASVPVGTPALVALLTAAGLAMGVTTPSRDMLVRGATPPGSTGKVFGFVYSGLDAGAAVAPTAVGLLLDRGHPAQALWLAAAALLLGVLTAVSLRRRSPVPAPAE
jgi:predicted MFS family arabinose efflux permease